MARSLSRARPTAARTARCTLEQRWADLVYDGQWFSPLRVAIDAYVDATQAHVTGEVRLIR